MALEYLEDFKQVLRDYQPAPTAVETLAKIPLVFLVAPTASGRNTIINRLVKTGRYYYIVSDTTRSPRVNNGVPEKDGREYWFRHESEMLDELKAGKFLEAAIIHGQQVSGTSIRELEKSAHSGKIAISEIEVVGADNIHYFKPDTIFIFVVAPDFNTWIERLTNRSKMSDDELKRRLESARNELTIALERDFYHLVVNRDIETAAKQIDALANHQLLGKESENQARQTAKQLLESLKKYLG